MGWFFIMTLFASAPSGAIFSDSEEVSVESMLASCFEADFVFIGEKHDDSFAHEWEFFMWEQLASKDFTLALEMFETDVQDILNSYLSGEITEEEFLADSRPWGNYETDYSPLVEFAKDNELIVLAANVPRRYAALVARGGFEAIATEPAFENLVIDSANVAYRERFLATMEALGGQMHAMPMDPENMYRAQLLKDAVMASSIAGVSAFVVCGSFHSDYHSGIPDQLGSDSYITISVLAPGETLDSEIADFVIVREN